MLALKFPPLEKLIEKNTSELDDDDPKKGVCISNGHAIVVMEQAVLFFDLASYFVFKNGINDNNILREMDAILSFMDNKMFSIMFWKELTNLNQVSVSSEGISLDGIIRKDIYYQEKIFDQTEIRLICSGIRSSENYSKSMNSVYIEPLMRIFSVLGLKKDTVIFKTVGENTSMYFTFDESYWIYGIVGTNPAVNTKNFVFDALNVFAEDFLK